MKLKIPFLLSFKPGRKGIQQVLGELEAEVMKTLWNKNEGVTGRQIYENMKRKRNLAYTTVLTVIDRLVNKGLIKKQKNNEDTYIFSQAISGEEFKTEITKAVVEGLMDFAGKGAVAAFMSEIGKSSPETIAELEKLIQARIGERS